MAANDDPLAPLQKLLAAKDAQIEALTSRCEVLADDIVEIRADRDLAKKRADSLEVALEQSQRETVSHQSRARRWEQDVRVALSRADNAEQALADAERMFANDLDEMRALCRAVTTEASNENPTEECLSAPKADPAIDVMGEELRQLEEQMLREASTATALTDAAIQENASLRSELAELQRQHFALQRQLDAREELARVTAERLQLSARLEVVKDALIDQTHEELLKVQQQVLSTPASPAQAPSAAPGAPKTPPPSSATPTARPRSHEGARSAGSFQHRDSPSGGSPTRHNLLASGTCLHQANTSVTRSRWLHEMTSRVPTSPAQPLVPSALEAIRGSDNLSAATLKFQAPVAFELTEREGYSRLHQAMNRERKPPGGDRCVPAAVGGVSPTLSGNAPEYTKLAASFGLSVSSPGTRAARLAAALATSSSPQANRATIAPRQRGYAQHGGNKTPADLRTHEQIRALLVAKETALSAVADL